MASIAETKETYASMLSDDCPSMGIYETLYKFADSYGKFMGSEGKMKNSFILYSFVKYLSEYLLLKTITTNLFLLLSLFFMKLSTPSAILVQQFTQRYSSMESRFSFNDTINRRWI